MKRILVDHTKCMGCKSCEIACAVEHSKSKTLIGALFETPKSMPRIRVKQVKNYSYPVRCQHCEDAPCIMACPTGALYREEDIGAVLVNENKCIGCWMCTLVCPFGAIIPRKEPTFALKCDFCIERQRNGLKPACVEACPTETLTLVEVEEEVERKRAEYAEKMMESAEEKPQPQLIEIWRAGKFQFV